MVTALSERKRELEVPAKNGKRIEAIIRKGLYLKNKSNEIKQATEKNNARLIPHAENLTAKTGLKSAVFKSEDGKVTVKFNESIVYDEKDMDHIKAVLGPIFTQMFHEVPRFAVNPEDIPEIKERLGLEFKRLVKVQKTHKHTKALLNLISDGDNEVARELRNHISVEPKKPTISYETVVE